MFSEKSNRELIHMFFIISAIKCYALPILPPVSYRKCVRVAISGSAVVNKHDKFPLGASSVNALDLRSLRPGLAMCPFFVTVCLAASSTILKKHIKLVIHT